MIRTGRFASSNLASYSYDEETRVLTITFASGSQYEYADVPPAVVDGLVAAPSAGKYFHASIRSSYAASPV